MLLGGQRSRGGSPGGSRGSPISRGGSGGGSRASPDSQGDLWSWERR